MDLPFSIKESIFGRREACDDLKTIRSSISHDLPGFAFLVIFHFGPGNFWVIFLIFFSRVLKQIQVCQ